MLRWNDLAKTYGRRRLFRGLSGTLDPGAGLLVTGPNGAGKSTFLKVLAGLARADAGTVERSEERNDLGYAAPDTALYAELTGSENIAFYLAVRGIAGSGAAEDRLLESLGLGRAASKPVAVYSTGMRQRLKLACALAHGPSLLILDEPTLGLDSSGIARVEEIIGEQIRSGRGSVIVATNDPGHVERLGGVEGGAGGRWSRLALGD